ncbi:phosphatidylinositol:ceramide inositolphosphotransferase 1 [Cucumis melo var. makuwa]|uniref:Phosphatidylinositol:ceramide inositolphosphotransferase 1 n=1 Tax=Cucumis melo var. makuwa TaxID=1194695 RepID=A0A5D3BC80_CUCMM|nr:phosphatidylinositol:ceramide inositolphosphotransferase 1 [Cucumis melo var. makuwa]
MESICESLDLGSQFHSQVNAFVEYLKVNTTSFLYLLVATFIHVHDNNNQSQANVSLFHLLASHCSSLSSARKPPQFTSSSCTVSTRNKFVRYCSQVRHKLPPLKRSCVRPPLSSEVVFFCRSSRRRLFGDGATTVRRPIAKMTVKFLGGMYIHGVAAHGVNCINRPSPILQDVGFFLLLELGPNKAYYNETLFTFIFLFFVAENTY